MNYQNTLIKRKEYFGLVWLAAHSPSKLSKIEIIRMDLSAKCEEITEYIINGKEKRPRFSLLVLSHLMYGLVVILNKKNTYLYNELVALKGMLSVSFFQTELKEKAKTSKKVKAADRRSITLKENIPEIFSQCSLETMELDRELERMSVREITYQDRYKSITLDESDDLISRSTIIPIEQDWGMWESSEKDNNGLNIIYDYNERQLLEITGKSTPQTRLSRLKEVSERTPFRDVTNEPDLARDVHTTRVGFINETTIIPEPQLEYNKEIDMETSLSRILDKFPMPNLFQETIIQPEPVQEQVEVHAFQSQIEVVQFPEEPTVTKGLTKSISTELQELKSNISKRIAARETAKERAVAKKNRLIIDNVTEIPTSELKNRMAPNFETEKELVIEQSKLFREKNPWLMTRNDYFLSDVQLFTAPFGQDARRTNFPLSDYAFFQRNSVRNQLVIKNNLLKSSRVQDDKYCYLTEARDRLREREQAQPSGQILPETIQAESMPQEIQRHGESFSHGLLEQTTITKGSSTKKKPSARESYISDMSRQLDTAEQMRERTMEIPLGEMSLPPMPQFDSFMEPQMPPPQVKPAEEQVVEPTLLQPDLDDYEKIIFDSLSQTDEAVVLQDLIVESTLTKRCLQSQKPRKYFAAKLFYTSLKMCGEKKIQLKQKSHYDSIYMKLNE